MDLSVVGNAPGLVLTHPVRRGKLCTSIVLLVLVRVSARLLAISSLLAITPTICLLRVPSLLRIPILPLLSCG